MPDGEHWNVGLSPRLRGNPMCRCQLGSLLRSIPAPAGEPQIDRRLRRPGGVYPRACGGT